MKQASAVSTAAAESSRRLLPLVPKLPAWERTCLRSSSFASPAPLINLDQLNIEHEVAEDRPLAGVGEAFGNPKTPLLAFDH